MNEIKFERILFVGLLLAVVGTTVFSFEIVQAQTAAVQATIKIAVCGNGIIEREEQCDRSNLAGKTCLGLGFGGGNLRCTSACTLDVSGCTSGGGGVGGGWVSPLVETKVILQGKAYPNSSITVLKDGKITTTVLANSKADFRAEITGITAGIYTFGLWAKDKNGIRSITYTLTFSVFKDTITTVSGIFLPPTIDIDKTALERGETLNIFGQTVPEVEIDVHIFSSETIEKITADEIGAWLLAFNTQPLEEGMHTTKTRFNLNKEERSGFSELLGFYVGKGVLAEGICPRADLNKDNRVNLVDFSILLYWWGKANACADQNGDGIVNLPDFSIMMYYWTG